MGLFEFPTYDGNRFFVTIVDDYKNFVVVLIMLKSDVCVIRQNFLL